jgi:hypothetical protein
MFLECYANYFLKNIEPPCVVLVIDENRYGLMIALSLSYRFSPYEMLEPYVGFKVARRSK